MSDRSTSIVVGASADVLSAIMFLLNFIFSGFFSCESMLHFYSFLLFRRINFASFGNNLTFMSFLLFIIMLIATKIF